MSKTRQTKLDEHGVKTGKTRQTRLTEFGIVLLMLSASLAGCADMIPDPPSEYNSVIGTFDTDNNSTIVEVAIGNNSSILEVHTMFYNVTTELNETLNIQGYVYQDNIYFQSGYALHIGKVYAHFTFIENATYTYEIFYS